MSRDECLLIAETDCFKQGRIFTTGQIARRRCKSCSVREVIVDNMRLMLMDDVGILK